MRELREEALTTEELQEMSGGAGYWTKARCEYTWAACLAFPGGCTNPCYLWRENCTK